MATDENYRKQYGGIIKNTGVQLITVKIKIRSSSQVRTLVGYGMKVNDGGTASFCSSEEIFYADQKAYREKAVERERSKRGQRKRKLREGKSTTS